MTRTEANLLWEVLAAPLDDAPRLIYADWLEENREAPRAEFVRVQCELAANYPGWTGEPSPDALTASGRYAVLRRRERELLDGICGLGVEALPVVEGLTRSNFVGRGGYGWYRRDHQEVANGIEAAFRRGFVARVALALDTFTEHATALFTAAPVEEVRLSGAEPYLTFAGWYGWANEGEDVRNVGSPSYLPPWLVERLSEPDVIAPPVGGYHTRERAFAALSAACVAHGRRLAGLPPLRTPQTEAARA